MKLDSDAQWNSFLINWQGWLSRLLNTEQAYQEARYHVPQSWLHLVESPNVSTIQNLWAGAEGSLPRFLGYLSWAILDARIAESKMGYLLIYKLKDWYEEDWYKTGVEVYADGFMMAGLPVKREAIINFESKIGSIPNCLQDLWLIHGFVQLRDDSFIASLDPQQQQLVHHPEIYLARRDTWQHGRILDCLGIANMAAEIVPALTRPLGSSTWQDYIVNASRWDETMHQALRFHLDDMLTDWFLRDWSVTHHLHQP